MGRVAGKLWVVAAFVLLVAVLAACGGGDEESTAEDTTTSAQQSPANEKQANEGEGAKPEKSGGQSGGGSGESSGDSGGDSGGSNETNHEDSGGGSEQFRSKGGDNSIQEFGGEADEDEFDQAAAAVHGFFDARVRGDWETACEYVAQDIVEALRPLAQSLGEDAGCAQLLAQISRGAPQTAFKLAAKADVGSVRVEDGQAFVLYHGAAGLDYAMPMKLEDGEWKVASLAGTPIS